MNNKKITKEAYDAIALRYYEEYSNDTSDFDYIDSFLKSCNSKILDLGCGMGHYSNYMQKKGFQVCGIDFSKQMLEIAKKVNSDIEFLESDICNLPKTLDCDFDGVLFAYVIQHLSKEEAKTVLLNLHNYIKKDCNLLILLNEGEGTKKEKEPFDSRFEYEIKAYSRNEIIELLKECGYQVIKTVKKKEHDDEYSLCPTTLVVFAKNGRKEEK